MKRFKKPKKKNPKTPHSIVATASCLNVAISVRNLETTFGWEKDKLAEFLEGYFVLMEEIADGRRSVNEEIEDCKALTGIDVRKIFNDMGVRF